MNTKIILSRPDNSKHFALEAKDTENHIIKIDANPSIGGTNTGMRPMDILLSSLAGCSSIDVLLILKKKRIEVEMYEVIAEGERVNVEEYSEYKNILLTFRVKAKGLTKETLEKIAQLSIDKYCSVSKVIEKTAKVSIKGEIIN